METLPSQNCCLCHQPLPTNYEQINGIKIFTTFLCCGATLHDACRNASKKKIKHCPVLTCKKALPKSPAKAIKLLQKHVKNNVGWAQFMLSQRYSSGRHGVPQSYERAAQLMELAAKNGVAAAMHTLGLCYKLGQGVDPDDAKALNYYKQAAELGAVMSMTNLGVIYFQSGEHEKGLKWTAKAASTGHIRAQENLAAFQYSMSTGKESRCLQGITGETSTESLVKHLSENVCSFCGKEDQSHVMKGISFGISEDNTTTKIKPFLKCNCKTSTYCNSICQKKHWTAHQVQHTRARKQLKKQAALHKEEGTVVEDQKELTSYAQTSAGLLQQMKLTKQTLKSFKKEGIQAPAELGWDLQEHISHLSAEQAKLFRYTLFPIVSEAHNDYLTSNSSKKKENHEQIARHKERTLTKLYDTIVHHEELFFKVFTSKEGYVLPERCTGMLGVLTTILRQRGDYLQAEKVMRIYSKTIDAYEAVMNVRANGNVENLSHNAFTCMDNLRYKYYLIRLNLWVNLKQQHVISDEIIGTILRWVCRWEIKSGKHEKDDCNWTWMIPLHCNAIKTEKVTLKQLKKLKNKTLAKVYRVGTKFIEEVKQVRLKKEGKTDQDERKHVAKQSCALCNKMEPFINEFKKCGRCKAVYYCCVEHQKEHWKEHKKDGGCVKSVK